MGWTPLDGIYVPTLERVLAPLMHEGLADVA